MRRIALYKIRVIHAFCKGCGICINLCPKKVFDLTYRTNVHNKIKGERKIQYLPTAVVVGSEECTGCRNCEKHCPDFAIRITKEILRIAHRGASKYEFENSRKAFLKAIELGIEVVEFDVHLAKDNEIVITHDDYIIENTTGNKTLLKDLTFQELKRIRHSNNEPPILTIEEVIVMLKDKCICKIDIKGSGMEVAISQLIREYNIEKTTIITSAIPFTVKKMKELNPNIKIEMGGFANNESAEEIINLTKECNAEIAGIHSKMATKKLVDEIRKNKLEIHVWPADDKNIIEKLKNMNVDGITSICPDLI